MNSDHYCRHPANMSLVCRPKRARFPHSIKQRGGGRRETGRNWQGRRSGPGDTAPSQTLGRLRQGRTTEVKAWALRRVLGWGGGSVKLWGAGDAAVIKCECARSPGFHLQHIKRSGSNWSGQRQLGSVLINTQTSFSFHAWDSFVQTGSTALLQWERPRAELAPCCSPLCLCLTDSARTVYFSEKGSVAQRLLEN